MKNDVKLSKFNIKKMWGKEITSSEKAMILGGIRNPPAATGANSSCSTACSGYLTCDKSYYCQ